MRSAGRPQIALAQRRHAEIDDGVRSGAPQKRQRPAVSRSGADARASIDERESNEVLMRPAQ